MMNLAASNKSQSATWLQARLVTILTTTAGDTA